MAARMLRIGLTTLVLALGGAGVAFGWFGGHGHHTSTGCKGTARSQYDHGCAPIAVTISSFSHCKIGKRSATIWGIVFPNGLQTRYHFEYRKNGSSTWISTPERTLASSHYPNAVSAYLTGLGSNTRYYVRLVAVNSMGSHTGNVESFTTSR